jgi:hypothetical protein
VSVGTHAGQVDSTPMPAAGVKKAAAGVPTAAQKSREEPPKEGSGGPSEQST